MEFRRYRTQLIILGMMALTSLGLAFTVDVTLSDRAGINRELPTQVNEYKGEALLFCQRKSCGKDWTLKELGGVTNRCPACLNPGLDTCSKIEREMLPGDTEIKKFRYVAEDQRSSYAASYVLSGKERVSIHRPEQCLSSVGNKITGQIYVDVPLEGREPLRVKILEMENTMDGADGKPVKRKTFYAYWFVGSAGRETASHWARMFYMSWDRIIHNQAHRWAYIAVLGMRGETDDDQSYQEPMKKFIAGFYPPQLEGVE